MTSFDFTTTTCGKWIVCGEHAVIRQHPALVFPVPNKTLEFGYIANNDNVKAEFSGEFGEDVHTIFWSVLERGLELTGHSISQIKGSFHLHSTVPIGAGLGASAAICVALGKWFIWQQYIAPEQLFDFSRQLEDLFHGKSSGLDIAAVIANQGIFYQNGDFSLINPTWQPHWYLSDSKHIGMTSHCVKKVNELWQRDAKFAERVDMEMNKSVELALQALQQDDVDIGTKQLAQAINLAKVCFNQWGLAGGHVEEHINQLLAAGALAAKPTGSGEGGYILSLWPQPIAEDKAQDFIAV